MFCQASVILLTGGERGYLTPPEQTPPGADPPGADTPQSRTPGAEPPPGEHGVRYGQRAGGTHPTGMQSCSYLFLPREAIFPPREVPLTVSGIFQRGPLWLLKNKNLSVYLPLERDKLTLAQGHINLWIRKTVWFYCYTGFRLQQVIRCKENFLALLPPANEVVGR